MPINQILFQHHNVNPNMAPSAATNSSVIVAVNNSTATVAAAALVINAAAAVDDDDNNSLSTQALLEENPAADDDSPGELELYVNNDENVAPQNRVNYMLMLAHKQGINVDEIYASIKSRPGKKSIFMWKKEALVAEIKRRNPNARANKKNASIPALFSKLTPLSPLDFPKDVAYIIAKEAEIRATLFAGVAQEDSEAATVASRQKATDWLRYVLILVNQPNVLSLYRLSQTPASREQLDAGETPNGLFHQKIVQDFNNSSIEVSTIPQSTLHSDFDHAIVCNKSDFDLTAEKSKKNMGEIRRNLTNMIAFLHGCVVQNHPRWQDALRNCVHSSLIV